MALPDLTGLNIEDTYQRVLHTDGVSVFDGTGSMVSLHYTGSFTGSFTGNLAGTATNAQDIIVYVKNVTGAPILKGKVVRISGATGDNALISTASYEDDTNSANTLGITRETIANDSFGYVITEGTLLGINTSDFTPGQLLYLGPAGSITGSAPLAPLHNVRLGEALRIQQNNGSMYVRIDNGYEIGELHDVKINNNTLATGNVLLYSGSVWTNVAANDIKERRYDSSASFAYCGTAPYSSSEADLTWYVTRLFLSSSGDTSVTIAQNVDWTNRYIHTYT